MDVTIFVDMPAHTKSAEDLWLRTTEPFQVPPTGTQRFRVRFTLPAPDADVIVAEAERMAAQVTKD